MKVVATLGGRYRDDSLYNETLSHVTSDIEDVDVMYSTREKNN